MKITIGFKKRIKLLFIIVVSSFVLSVAIAWVPAIFPKISELYYIGNERRIADKEKQLIGYSRGGGPLVRSASIRRVHSNRMLDWDDMVPLDASPIPDWVIHDWNGEQLQDYPRTATLTTTGFGWPCVTFVGQTRVMSSDSVVEAGSESKRFWINIQNTDIAVPVGFYFYGMIINTLLFSSLIAAIVFIINYINCQILRKLM